MSSYRRQPLLSSFSTKQRGPSAPSDPVSLLIQHSLTRSFLKYFYFYTSVCASVCMYSHMYAGTCRVHKWVPDTLELEVQAAMSPAMDTGPWTSAEAANALGHCAISAGHCRFQLHALLSLWLQVQLTCRQNAQSSDVFNPCFLLFTQRQQAVSRTWNILHLPAKQHVPSTVFNAMPSRQVPLCSARWWRRTWKGCGCFFPCASWKARLSHLCLLSDKFNTCSQQTLHKCFFGWMKAGWRTVYDPC